MRYLYNVLEIEHHERIIQNFTATQDVYKTHSFIDTLKEHKLIHVLKSNPVFLYTVIDPKLSISPEKIKAAIDTEVGAGSAGQTCNQSWKLLGK